MSKLSQPSDRELIIERTFDAPRALVWEAFTDPAHVDHWWGPNGFRNQTQSHDFRVGGLWRFTMHGPDGHGWPNWIRYDEIDRPSRLVYSQGGDDLAQPMFQVTVTFTEIGARTKLRMHSVFPTAEGFEAVKKHGAVEGAEQHLARFAAYLPSVANGAGPTS